MRGRVSRPIVRRKYERTLPRTKLVSVFPELPGACRRGEKRLVLALLGLFIAGLFLTGCSIRKPPSEDRSLEYSCLRTCDKLYDFFDRTGKKVKGYVRCVDKCVEGVCEEEQ